MKEFFEPMIEVVKFDVQDQVTGFEGGATYEEDM